MNAGSWKCLMEKLSRYQKAVFIYRVCQVCDLWHSCLSHTSSLCYKQWSAANLFVPVRYKAKGKVLTVPKGISDSMRAVLFAKYNTMPKEIWRGKGNDIVTHCLIMARFGFIVYCEIGFSMPWTYPALKYKCLKLYEAVLVTSICCSCQYLRLSLVGPHPKLQVLVFLSSEGSSWVSA